MDIRCIGCGREREDVSITTILCKECEVKVKVQEKRTGFMGVQLDQVTTLNDLPLVSEELTYEEVLASKKNEGLRSHPCSKEFKEAMEEVDRPEVSHYQNGEVEPIDLINSHNLNFNLGNIIKYATRCHLKGTPEQDLKKVIDYANFELKRIASV